MKPQLPRWSSAELGVAPAVGQAATHPQSLCRMPAQSSGRGSSSSRQLGSSFGCESLELSCWRARHEVPHSPPLTLFRAGTPQRAADGLRAHENESPMEGVYVIRGVLGNRISQGTCSSNISQKCRSPSALTTCDLQLFKEKHYSESQI